MAACKGIAGTETTLGLHCGSPTGNLVDIAAGDATRATRNLAVEPPRFHVVNRPLHQQRAVKKHPRASVVTNTGRAH